MESGAIGTVGASRVITGSNTEFRIEIHGSKGAIYFNFMDPNWFWFYDTKGPEEPIGGLRGLKKIETVQRYPRFASLPEPKFSIGWIGYYAASQFDFVSRIAERKEDSPIFTMATRRRN